MQVRGNGNAMTSRVKGTHNLLRTRARGATSPMPMTKLMIFATRVSKPAMINRPPKMVEPT